MLLLLLACTRPPAPPADLPEGLRYGDPIQVVSQWSMEEEGGDRIREWMAAAFLSDDIGVLIGESGVGTVRLPSLEPIHVTNGQRGYRAALDGERLWVATRSRGLYALDLSDPADPVEVAYIPPGESWHEDVAADDGLVLVGGQEAGGLLYTSDGVPLGVLPADYAFGVALRGDRALVCDGPSLVLWDLSNVQAPVELDRMSLPATGRDLSLDGERVAVSMGGSGVAVVSLADDVLVLEADLTRFPGAPASVALSGELLWVAAWEQVSLVQRVEGAWVEMAHEPAAHTAMGVAARGGQVLVADFTWQSLFEAPGDLAAPELALPERSRGQLNEARSLEVRNHGLGTLELVIDKLSGVELIDVELSDGALSIPEGERALLRLTVTHEDATLSWTSNDPDEPEGELLFEPALVEGLPHPDFTLEGFTAPDSALSAYTLSEQRGEVVFLGYFTTW